jgi:hypothetical protein
VGSGNSWTAEQIADGLAYVCENIDQIRATLKRGPAGGRRQLDHLLAALLDGSDPAGLLQAVHGALRRAGDALGVFVLTRDPTMLRLTGIEADRPPEPILLCPRTDHPCSRYALPGPAGVPVCHVTGGSLRRITLQP